MIVAWEIPDIAPGPSGHDPLRAFQTGTSMMAFSAGATNLAAGIMAGVVGGIAAVAAAQDPAAFEFQPTKPVPPHGQPWVETPEPDVRTALLWKFVSEADRAAVAEKLLDDGELDDLVADEDALPTAGVAGKGAGGQPPKLIGRAAIQDAAGRFGGGLVLDGQSHAEGSVDFPGLVAREGGFTIDFWFRAAGGNGEPAAGPQTLFLLPSLRGEPLLAVRFEAPGQVVLAVAGADRVTASCPPTADGWHHVAVVADVPRGQPDAATLSLAVDGVTAAARSPDPATGTPWMKGGLARVGAAFTAGGGPGVTGLTGGIDELRVSKGVRLLYPWNLGRLERTRTPDSLELRAPYFKSGAVRTRLRFDGSLEPEPFAGRSWTGKADASHFKPGVQGQALDLSAIDKTGFALKGFDILPDKDGTVEFWFRPLDWHNFYKADFHGTGIKHTWLMTLKAADAPAHAVSKTLDVRLGRAGRDGPVQWQKIHPGTWTHVLCSFKDGRQTVYLNGRPQRLHQAALATRARVYDGGALEKWRERTGGQDVDDTWTLAFTKSPTLVDEFTVFDWGLDADEAWNAYARWLPDAAAAMKPLPLFQTRFDYFAHSWDREEKLVATVGCLPVNGVNPAAADIEIRDAAGAVLSSAEKQSLAEGATAKFTLAKPLPFGRYSVLVRSRDASGKVLAEEKLEYLREQPEWLGNTLGKERTIPAPWTPITVNGESLELVGRRIDLGSNGLPAKIETHGRQILARPIAIRAAGPGGDATLAGEGLTFGETADDRVEWQAALAGAGIKADVDASLEFDGLLYCTVTLAPAAGAEVALDELDIDVPLVAAEATQLLANGGGNDFRNSWIATMLPAGEGSVWRSSDKPYPSFGRADGVTNFMPHIWLGADDVGLYFGAENDKGWTVDGPNPAQEILREKDTVVFRMNVIREATTIPAAGRTFHFLLLPTPAKPEPADWRKQMTTGGVNFGSCDTFGGFEMKTDPADPMQGDDFRLEPRSWEHAAVMSPQCRDKWGRCILYADASYARPGPAFRDYDHDTHAGTGRHAWTPEFEDYVVWAVNEFLERGLIDGIYWDDVSVGNTYSLDSTAYEYAGGKNGRRVGFTALAQRRTNMRLWRLFEAAGREPCIWAHMTVCHEVPLFSFCRYLANGEFTTGVEPYGKRDAMDFWSPERLRVLGSSAKWGTGVMFLSTLPKSLPLGPAAERWAYGQIRTEDALYATSGIQTLSDGLVRKLIKAKLYDGPLRCFPWWEADRVLKLAKPDKAAVLSAVYATPDKAVVFVANFDRDAEHELTVELDPATLFPGRRVTGLEWRDLDPGLEPPQVAVASAAEIAKETKAAANAGIEGQDRPLDEEELGDFLEGTTPHGRAKGRLEMKVEGSKARVTIRPRDYRVLEARPR
jgi:hypothetical protein